METLELKEKEVKALNDLIMINHDRSSGYEKAMEVTEDLKLKVLFSEYIIQSNLFKAELEVPVLAFGGEVHNEATFAGKIHHAWMDLKAGFAGKDRASILKDCAFGDNAAEMAYATVLKEVDLSWNKKIVDLVTMQHEKIQEAHTKIQAMIDNE